jgi:hypothetical protein
MPRKDDLLDRMRRNPVGDWTIKDVETVCRQHGIACSPPSRGDHFKISHRSQNQILTIPAHRPIKPFYIRELVKFVACVGGPDDTI